MIRIIAFNVAVWLLANAPLYAEVSDKEPTIAANWAWAVIGGVLAIFAWRWRVWLGALVSAIALGGAWLVHEEMVDPFVGPAIRTEAGPGYVTQFYLSAATALVLHLGAAYAALRRGGRAKRF